MVDTVKEEETWVDLGGCKVSDLGRVELPNRGITCGWGRNGYLAVSIKGKKEYVHRLVAKNFCGGYDEGLVVDHIDGNKVNNKHTNLRWVTLSQNAVGKGANIRKITDDEVSLMWHHKSLGKNNTEIAFIIGTDRRNVSRIINGRSRKDLTVGGKRGTTDT